MFTLLCSVRDCFRSRAVLQAEVLALRNAVPCHMKDPHFLSWEPMFHWTDSKIRVHAFYCVLALLLTSLLQRELAQKGEELSTNRILEELGSIRETLIVYPRRQGQRQSPTVTCLTRR